MVITTISILIVTYVSGRHVRKKAMSNLSEAGKQKEARATRWSKLVMNKESYNSKGLRYRRILLAIMILGFMLATAAAFYNF
jgi:hypothetical protein